MAKNNQTSEKKGGEQGKESMKMLMVMLVALVTQIDPQILMAFANKAEEGKGKSKKSGKKDEPAEGNDEKNEEDEDKDWQLSGMKKMFESMRDLRKMLWSFMTKGADSDSPGKSIQKMFDSGVPGGEESGLDFGKGMEEAPDMDLGNSSSMQGPG